ncbi:nucleotidyl transferase AbiEii/AbiGii toxin family protein [Micromonospora sp. LOL_015]|uniref:nucleotidyl transferase AbiEii/AbiGii toxin family protein n=1 Tax=Micromonospora sp. LOL_015 TaxID=3345416 RepID=UPI003A8AAF16
MPGSVADVETASTSTVERGIDWRAYPPVQLAIGPVLHPADAVANKLCALFGRAEVRDYIDVYGVLRDGRYSGSEMLRDHDPGFDRQVFAEALRAVRRFPDSAFDPYRLSPDEIVTLCNHWLAWADEIACLNQ